MKTFEIRSSENYKLEEVIGSPLELLNWTRIGLPDNRESIQNAIIMKEDNKWSLSIDPQNQANLFIRKKDPKVYVIQMKGKYIKLLQAVFLIYIYIRR